MSNPQYVNHEGQIVDAINTLTPVDEAHLRNHVRHCGSVVSECPSCFRFYSNVGGEEFVALLVEGKHTQKG